MGYVLLLLFGLILITNISLEIINIDDKTDVLIKLTKFEFHLNYEKFIQFFTTSRKNRDQISLEEIVENLQKFQDAKKLFKDICQRTTIEEVKIINKLDINEPDNFFLVNMLYWSSIGFIQNYFYTNFHEIKKENYLVENTTAQDLDFHIQFKVRFYNILFSVIKNIKDVPKIIKNYI